MSVLRRCNAHAMKSHASNSLSHSSQDACYNIVVGRGENLGRMYYNEYNLSVLCIRMGHVSAAGKPGWGSNYEEGNPASLGRDISIYTSHRDIAQST